MRGIVVESNGTCSVVLRAGPGSPILEDEVWLTALSDPPEPGVEPCSVRGDQHLAYECSFH